MYLVIPISVSLGWTIRAQSELRRNYRNLDAGAGGTPASKRYWLWWCLVVTGKAMEWLVPPLVQVHTRACPFIAPYRRGVLVVAQVSPG